MSRPVALVLGLSFAGLGMVQPARAESVETILFLRHGEKSADGLGQLSCQGLNRALALPKVLKHAYGRLDAVFAPDPAHQKPDGANDDGSPKLYDYVRPLATAEPSAIAFGLPIRAGFGYEDSGKLKAALLDPALSNATVLVVWEHHVLNKLVPEFAASLGGDANAIGKWTKTDFDSIWRVTIRRNGAEPQVSFAHDHQGLDGQPTVCGN